MDTKPTGRSILRRSSVVLQRRLSRDSSALEEFQAQQQQSIWSANAAAAAAQRRASVQQISADQTPPIRRASISVGRRSSIAALKKSKEFMVGSLSRSSGIPNRYLQQAHYEQGKADHQLQQQHHQHDYKQNKGAILSPTMDSLGDFKDMSVSSDWDLSSNCSEISELLEDVDCTDPCDWFLDEEMEDEPMFEILEKQELILRMRSSVNSVASQLNVSPGDAVLVLQEFNWDVDDLLHDYFDRPSYYLTQAGVTDRSNTTSQTTNSALGQSTSSDSGQSTSSESDSELDTCKVCLEDRPAGEFFALGCGHTYCKECWQVYLQGEALTSGSSLTRTPCMAPKCPAKLTEQDFEFLALPSTLQRYMYFLLKEYSEKELHAVFCPNPACGNAVVYSGVGRPTDVVECHCGTRFCFSCGHEKHNPVDCDRLLEWLALLQDDSESLGYIKATSKPCFHCGTFTERISGCNHMICRRDWATHGAHTGGFYSCNKYEESEAKVIDDESQKFLNTKNESKFLHYYNRYFNHDVLMKDVMKELNSGDVETTMGEYSKMTNADPEFFLEAAELLVECRRVLKYTYVYGYYMEDSPAKALFEYQQASAEGITERLSELFHTPVDVIAKSPLEFVNYVRVTKKFISNLVKSIEEGFTSDMEFQQSE